MANVIIPNGVRKVEAEYIMDKYGVDKRDPAMREAAEITAARSAEAVKMGNETRRYF